MSEKQIDDFSLYIVVVWLWNRQGLEEIKVLCFWNKELLSATHILTGCSPADTVEGKSVCVHETLDDDSIQIKKILNYSFNVQKKSLKKLDFHATAFLWIMASD